MICQAYPSDPNIFSLHSTYINAQFFILFLNFILNKFIFQKLVLIFIIIFFFSFVKFSNFIFYFLFCVKNKIEINIYNFLMNRNDPWMLQSNQLFFLLSEVIVILNGKNVTEFLHGELVYTISYSLSIHRVHPMVSDQSPFFFFFLFLSLYIFELF